MACNLIVIKTCVLKLMKYILLLLVLDASLSVSTRVSYVFQKK